jgi:hypothetical protein
MALMGPIWGPYGPAVHLFEPVWAQWGPYVSAGLEVGTHYSPMEMILLLFLGPL